ncbi:hypothetical protein [Paramuribaculum intestinale]|jgi:hypothetical protein|uniref:hypothetical protein n=1 Tax=Paramuribaculum intestinale TaxID=2094151 RepID=UPI000F46B177|nr:hypothetical protein [Paramuribaculum intestinale]ROT16634.1 hypothetical protein EEL50_02135 [Muribaculaceae bacterium Isolate-105 (HZI)]
MEQNITLELVYQRQVSLEQTLNLILELLKTEEKKKKEMQEAAEDISAIPPIPNSLAAKLLKITTRQLQRKRREYKLTWIERGREVYYHIVPIIKAIHRLQLKWNESVLEDIKKSNHRIPRVK